MNNTPPSANTSGREVPKEVRYFTSGFVFRKLTLRERLLILAGRNLALEIHIATEQRPGAVRPLVEVSMTKAQDGETAMRGMKARAQAKKNPLLPTPPAAPVSLVNLKEKK